MNKIKNNGIVLANKKYIIKNFIDKYCKYNLSQIQYY